MADKDDSPRMTLRVYTVTPEGVVTNDSGVRPIGSVEVGSPLPPDSTSAYPPCGCGREDCRASRRAKARR